MAHRLLHTLVFSSAVALEAGCAASHALPPGDAGRGAAIPAADASADAITDAMSARDAHVALCEGGWPSTKGYDCEALDELGPAGGTVLSCVLRSSGATPSGAPLVCEVAPVPGATR